MKNITTQWVKYNRMKNEAKDNLSIAKQQVIYRKPLSYHIFTLSDSSNFVSIC